MKNSVLSIIISLIFLTSCNQDNENIIIQNSLLKNNEFIHNNIKTLGYHYEQAMYEDCKKFGPLYNKRLEINKIINAYYTTSDRLLNQSTQTTDNKEKLKKEYLILIEQLNELVKNHKLTVIDSITQKEQTQPLGVKTYILLLKNDIALKQYYLLKEIYSIWSNSCLRASPMYTASGQFIDNNRKSHIFTVDLVTPKPSVYKIDITSIKINGLNVNQKIANIKTDTVNIQTNQSGTYIVKGTFKVINECDSTINTTYPFFYKFKN
jgi:hypothetical protein